MTDFDGNMRSQVRGNCEFCADGNHMLEHPPCSFCYREPSKPQWSPSATGRIALLLDEEIAGMQTQLDEIRQSIDEIRAALDGAQTEPSADMTPYMREVMLGRERYGYIKPGSLNKRESDTALLNSLEEIARGFFVTLQQGNTPEELLLSTQRGGPRTEIIYSADSLRDLIREVTRHRGALGTQEESDGDTC